MKSRQPSALSRQLLGVAVVLSSCTLPTIGCNSPQGKPQWVYFPPPPDAPRVVHLLSFNRLHELVPPQASWVDFFRGIATSPWVGTPMGIAYHDDSLYICDTHANCVHAWNLATGSAKRIGAGGDLKKPVAVAVDDSGTVFVADTIRGEVVGFDPASQEIRRFRPGDRSNYRPVAVAVSKTDLYVADIVNHRVDIYSTETGKLSKSLGRPGSREGDFYYPSGVAVGPGGRIYVADMMNARVQVFDEKGNFLHSIGAPGNHYGNLGKPRDVAVAHDGTVFVADAEFGYVHLFDAQGRLLLVVGGPRDRPGGTPLPNGIAIATLVPRKLQELAPGGFIPRYYVFVSNTTGRKRLALFAVGSPEPEKE